MLFVPQPAPTTLYSGGGGGGGGGGGCTPLDKPHLPRYGPFQAQLRSIPRFGPYSTHLPRSDTWPCDRVATV